MTFTPNGLLETPENATFDMSWLSGGSAAVDFDLSGVTQFDGDLVPFKYEKNGFVASDLTRLQFDRDGHIVASFDDGTTRKLYRVPLAVFTNPNGLVERNGNVFQEGPEAGNRLVVLGGTNGFAEFAPNTREVSNVDIGQEFTQMILVQNAYNLSATSFRTVDEMTEVARDLKR
jgi:flagellar hook protein FlgE